MLTLVRFSGNPNVGVFARATETHAFVPPTLTPGERRDAEAALEVALVATTVGGTTLLGSLLAANRHGVAVSDIVTEREAKALEASGLRVEVFADRPNAIGNSVLVTDQGALVNPDYSDEAVARFAELFRVPVARGTLAGHGTVGMAGVATAQGVLVHVKATPEEREAARRALGHEAMLGTINHGTGLVGAGLVANSRGALIGAESTTIEINRIEDALGFLPPQSARPR